jgi:hypothetical protein
MRSRTRTRTVSVPLAAVTGIALTIAAVGAPASAEGPDAVRTNAAFATNVLPANDDESTAPVPLGFTADFFGSSYSQVYVNNNGNITFDRPLGTYTPFQLTTSGTTKIIAPFFADVDTTGAGSGLTRYGYGTGEVDGHLAFGVNWIDVGYYRGHTDKLNSFQLVLIQREDTGNPDNFDIEFNYDKVQWETGDASGGSGGLGGSSARIGYSSGTGEAFQLPGSGVNGAFLDGNGTSGVIHNSMNSTQLGRYVLQVRNGVVLPPENQAPVAVAGEDVSGDEGAAIALDGSASSDADDDPLTYSWSWSGDPGNDAGADCVIADPAAASTTITCDDDGSYTATLEVSDGEDAATDDVAVIVGNVAPVIGTPSLTGATGVACQAGNTVGLDFGVSDAGANDLGDLVGSVDWGDGSSEPFTGTSFAGSHLYVPGTYTVQISAGDGDGGTDAESLAGAVSHLYETSGLLEPVNPDGSSTFRLGSTVPLKIQVTDCDGVLVTSATPDVNLVKVDAAAPDDDVNEVISSSAADDGDNMRWSEDKHIFNLSTKRSQFCTVAMCGTGDNLTAGRYRVTISDESANDTFAPVVSELSLR